jgi:hypothetical protein
LGAVSIETGECRKIGVITTMTGRVCKAAKVVEVARVVEVAKGVKVAEEVGVGILWCFRVPKANIFETSYQ